jgi:hypothetical protein
MAPLADRPGDRGVRECVDDHLAAGQAPHPLADAAGRCPVGAEQQTEAVSVSHGSRFAAAPVSPRRPPAHRRGAAVAHAPAGAAEAAEELVRAGVGRHGAIRARPARGCNEKPGTVTAPPFAWPYQAGRSARAARVMLCDVCRRRGHRCPRLVGGRLRAGGRHPGEQVEGLRTYKATLFPTMVAGHIFLPAARKMCTDQAARNIN